MRCPPGRMMKIGFLELLAGLGLILAWGGLNDLQGAKTGEALAAAAVDQGNGARYASLADIFVFVPGYVLLMVGLLRFARADRATAWRRLPATIGFALVVLAATADQVENVTLQLALGTVDLGAPGARIAPGDGLMDVFSLAYDIKNGAFYAAAAFSLALGAWAGIDRRRLGRGLHIR